ncbi:MAG TPA: glycosyltransferase [Actinoplanes sp.]
MREPNVASEALLDDYVTAIGSPLRTALAATAIRNRSVAARHLLARAALGTAGTLADLLTAARAGDRRWLSRIRSRVDAGVLCALAQTIALQDLEPDDRTDALAIYDLVRSTFGPEALTPANQGLHAQLALAGNAERARRLLDAYRGMTDTIRAGIEVDLLNPFVAARPAEPWLTVFGQLLPEPRPTLGGPAAPAPFDRLTCDAARPRVEAPHRVSVVVTAYRPGDGLITAVRSIVGQTWANIEVVLVDDGSPPEFDAVLARATALGDRIRLVRLPANAGTYAARNAGLDAAAGEFVAFQDSDDWSHPRRLELQVQPLLENRRLVATTSDGLAVTEDLRVSRLGIRSGRLNPSSLVFRRSAVVGRIGYFDHVRKAADSEYIGRIQAAFGRRSVSHVEDGPLALIRLSADSLSRAEIKAHWMHPARVAYSSAYLRWHRLIARGDAPPYRPADGSDRPYAVPAHLTTRGVRAPRGYDVVLVADWRFCETAQLTAIDEIRAMVDAGLRVGIGQLESYRGVQLRRAALCTPIQELINGGRVDQVLLADRADTALLLVRQVAALQFPPAGGTGIRAGRVVVVADRAPVRGDGADRRYLPAECTTAARRLFDVEPLWCPQDAGVRASLRTVEPGLAMTDTDLPTVVDVSGWVAERAAAADVPIIGTDLCDAAAWPADADDAVRVHRRLAGTDVRIRLPDRPKWKMDVPAEWLAYAAADLGPRPFLHQLDFYCHFPHPRAAEVFSRPALEAAGLGCVVVLPERFAALYGDAAVYAEPGAAAAVLERYRADPERYAEQSRRARAVVAKAHHPGLFVDRIRKWLP